MMCRRPAGSGFRPNGVSPPTTGSEKAREVRDRRGSFSWRAPACSSGRRAVRSAGKLFESFDHSGIRPRSIQQARVVDREEPIERARRVRIQARGGERAAHQQRPRLRRPSGRPLSSVIGAPPSSTHERVGGCGEILVRVDERSVEIEDDQIDGASRPVVRRGGRVDRAALIERRPSSAGSRIRAYPSPPPRSAPW